MERKVFQANVYNRLDYDESINKILKEITEEGHTLVSYATMMIGSERMQTEVIYRENFARKVIVEKEQMA